MRGAIRVVVGGEWSCLPVSCSLQNPSRLCVVAIFTFSFAQWLFSVSGTTLS